MLNEIQMVWIRNLVPRVSQAPGEGKMRDPGNEAVEFVGHEPGTT